MANTTTLNPLNDFEREVWEQSSIHSIISRAVARPDAATFKFDGEMVRASKPLWDWAEYLVDHYVGTFELMVDFRTKQRLGRQLSENQLKVALNTLLSVWRQSLKQTQARVAAAGQAKVAERKYPDVFDQTVDLTSVPTFTREVVPNPEGGRPSIEPQDTIYAIKAATIKAPTIEIGQVPTDGTYTYVTGNGDYRVVRFNTPRTKDNQPGTVTWVSYQYGPDNDAEFAKCGRISDNALTIWQKAYLKGDQKVALDNTQRADLVEAISFICSLEKDDLLKSGEAYALRSGNCFMCGRTLTVPSSISAGIGPVCAKRWGI